MFPQPNNHPPPHHPQTQKKEGKRFSFVKSEYGTGWIVKTVVAGCYLLEGEPNKRNGFVICESWFIL